MLDIIRRISQHPLNPISPDQFHEWKHDPVTEELFTELALAVVEQLSDDLPEDSIDRSMIMAHQREGARKMLEVLFEWEPRNVLEIKSGDAKDDT